MPLWGMTNWSDSGTNRGEIEIKKSWVRTCNPDMLGIALYRMEDMMFDQTRSWKWRVLQSQVDAVRQLRIPFTRVYNLYNETWGGTLGSDAAFNETLRRLRMVCDTFGIPYSKCLLCYDASDDSVGYAEDASNTKLSQHMVEATDAGFLFHEVDNEPYNRAWKTVPPYSRYTYDATGQSQYVTYQNYARTRVNAQRPHARVGISVQGNHLGGVYWGSNMLSDSGTNFDWVHVHWYPWYDADNLQRAMQPNLIREVSRFNSLMNTCLTKYGDTATYPKLAVTEWGTNWTGTNGLLYSNGLPGIIFNIALLLYFHDTFPHLMGMTGWALFGYHTDQARYRMLTPKAQQDTRGWLYWMYYMLRRYWGEYMLTVGGSSRIYYLKDYENNDRPGLATPIQAAVDLTHQCVTVIMCNLSTTEEITNDLIFRDWDISDVTGWLMWHPSWTQEAVVSSPEFPAGTLFHQVRERSGTYRPGTLRPVDTDVTLDGRRQAVRVTLPPVSAVFLRAHFSGGGEIGLAG